MSGHFDLTINAIQDDIRKADAEIAEKKKLVNMLCDQAKRPRIYGDAELAPKSSVSLSIKKDQFFNQSLNGSIRGVLEHRRNASMEPPSAEEIYDTLIAGGYNDFPNDREQALKGLKITLGKSTATFARLPNGSYGLNEWYGITKPRASSASTSQSGATAQASSTSAAASGTEYSDFTPANS